MNLDNKNMWFCASLLDLVLPQVDYVVLMVSSVEVDVARVDEQERKQDDEDLNGVSAPVYKVSVKHVGFLQGRHAVL